MSKKARRNKRVQQQKLNQRHHQHRKTKQQIIDNAGTRCMLCGHDVGHAITWHHMQPRYAGGTNAYENASLLCERCHRFIHIYLWESLEYTYYTRIILNNRWYFLTGEGEPHFERPS